MSFYILIFFFFFPNTGCGSVAQASLELMILPSQPLQVAGITAQICYFSLLKLRFRQGLDIPYGGVLYNEF